VPVQLPDWCSPIDCDRVEAALSQAAAPREWPRPDHRTSVVILTPVQQDYPTELATIAAVEAVVAVISDVFRQRRDRWSTQPDEARRAADDLLEDVIRWAYAWHPLKATTSLITFADHVRDVVSTRSWWRDFVKMLSGAGDARAIGTIARVVDERAPLSISEAAERLGISDDSLRRMEKAGKIAFSRLSARLVKVPQAEIDRLLETGEYPKTR